MLTRSLCLAISAVACAIAQDPQPPLQPRQSAIFVPAPHAPRTPTDFWHTFFVEVAALKNDNKDTRDTTLQDAMGLNDQEAQVLSTIAADCLAQQTALDAEQRALTFDSRLENIRTGEMGKELSAKLEKNEARRRDLIPAHVRALRQNLPAERFQIIDAYVSEKAGKGLYFPK
jgi:hypothetical protein